MTRAAHAVAFIAAVLAAASVARADLSRGAWPVADQSGVACREAAQAVPCTNESRPLLGMDSYAGIAQPRSELLVNPGALTLSGEDAAGGSSVRELPPAPGGASLLLSGLLTLGALRLARSAKNIHLAALPAWYHEACPERIGHTVAFDFDLADMPVCFVADIATADVEAHAPAIHEYLREFRSRIQSQFILPIIAPRGPPANV